MKIIALIMACVLIAGVFCCCAQPEENGGAATEAQNTTEAEETEQETDKETELETETKAETEPVQLSGELVFEDEELNIFCTGIEQKNDSLMLLRFAAAYEGERDITCWVKEISADGVASTRETVYLIASINGEGTGTGTVVLTKGDFGDGGADLSAVEKIGFTLEIFDENDPEYSVVKNVTLDM